MDMGISTMNNGTVTYNHFTKNGRLGNQMYQAAATIAYALDHKKEFAFPLEWEYNKYMFRSLPMGAVEKPTRYNEPTFHYTPIPFIEGDVDLFGYFQSPRYIDHRREDIRPYFTLNDQYHYYIWEKYGKILNGNTCSIHIRRGDYTTTANLCYHGVMPASYYRRAILELYGEENPEEVTFIVCSDDLEWAKIIFNSPNIIFIENEKDIIDLFIMSYCQHHIISNSSFGWWSAWLGKNTNKKVIAPEKWFTNERIDSKDIYCEGWIVL